MRLRAELSDPISPNELLVGVGAAEEPGAEELLDGECREGAAWPIAGSSAGSSMRVGTETGSGSSTTCGTGLG